MSARAPTRADYVKAARELGVELEPETSQKYGHVIGLNLSRKNQDGPPITIDGVPFTDVGAIIVDAAPRKGIRVTVTFNASHLGGIDAPEEPTDANEFDLSMTYPDTQKEIP